MGLDFEDRVSLEAKLADLATAYRLVRELNDSLESSRARARAATAMAHIENVGTFLARLGKENTCQAGAATWKQQTAAERPLGAFVSAPHSTPAETRGTTHFIPIRFAKSGAA